MLRSIIISTLLVCSLIVSAQHTNIRIDGSVNSPNEPTIAINPNNTMQLIAGTNLNYYYISNGGRITWNNNTLHSNEHGVWGDPCIVADTDGTFYYFHLANPSTGNWIDRIVCQKIASIIKNRNYTRGKYIEHN
ncbi:MAG: hypothetical protein U9R32_00775 [Bacteroidota bacterium]|nr:hypothetical protein [Bacteroidota bacterium]